MKILITAREILDRGNWEAFCDMKGYNVWAINEGLMNSSEEFALTMEEAYIVGLRFAVVNALQEAEGTTSKTCDSFCKHPVSWQHSCPYQTAIKSNDNEKHCSCCDNCIVQCQQSI